MAESGAWSGSQRKGWSKTAAVPSIPPGDGGDGPASRGLAGLPPAVVPDIVKVDSIMEEFGLVA